MNIKIVRQNTYDKNCAENKIGYIDEKFSKNGKDRSISTQVINIEYIDINEAFQSFNYEIENARPNSKPYFHFVISWSPLEFASENEIKRVIDELMLDLGVPHHKAIYCTHYDTSNLHVHLLLSRVDPNTNKLANIADRFYKKAINKIMEEITNKYGWAHEKNGRYTHDNIKFKINNKSKANINLPKTLRQIIKKTFNESDNWQQFHITLARTGPRFFLGLNKNVCCCYNGVVYHSGEFSRELSLEKFIAKFNKFEEHLNDHINFKPAKPHSLYPRNRTREYVPIELPTCNSLCIYPRLENYSFLPTNAKINTRKNSYLRWESQSQSNWHTLEKTSITIEKFLSSSKNLIISCQIGKNPDTMQLNIDAPIQFFIANFIRKSQQTGRDIKLFLSSKVSCDLFFSMNYAALKKFSMIFNRFSTCTIAHKNYVKVNLKDFISNEELTHQNLILRVIADLFKESILDIDTNAKQEPGLLIFDNNNALVEIKNVELNSSREELRSKIKIKIHQIINYNQNTRSLPIKDFLQDIRQKLNGNTIHFSREIFIFLYFGIKKHGANINIESIKNVLKDVHIQSEFSNREIDQMFSNFEYAFNTPYKKPNSSRISYTELVNLADSAVKDILTCDDSNLSFKIDYWAYHLKSDDEITLKTQLTEIEINSNSP